MAPTVISKTNKRPDMISSSSSLNGNVNVALPAEDMEMSSDSDDDEIGPDGTKGRSIAMMFDRSLVGDRNGLKTAIIKAVYENQIHLHARKGESFDQLATTLGKNPDFKPYNLHGRKLQKSFNKIARDIKDCILAGNDPTRWGKEEPEFFALARKIFDEARRAGIRAFDEKLKSKSIEDRMITSDEKLEENKRKMKKRDFNTFIAEGSSSSVNGDQNSVTNSALATLSRSYQGDFADWTKTLEDYLNLKLQEIRVNLDRAQVKLTRDELEAGLNKAVEQLASNGITSIDELLNQAAVSEPGKMKIYQCGFNANDSVLIFLLTYSDAIAKDAHPITSIREQFDNITARDASVLYSFVGRTTK